MPTVARPGTRTSAPRRAWCKAPRSTSRTCATQTVTSPFTLSLGVLGGLGIAPAGIAVKDSGHFRLVLL
jgi:hypothetical protein